MSRNCVTYELKIRSNHVQFQQPCTRTHYSRTGISPTFQSVTKSCSQHTLLQIVPLGIHTHTHTHITSQLRFPAHKFPFQLHIIKSVKYEVLMAVTVNCLLRCDTMQPGKSYHHFRETCCHYLQGRKWICCHVVWLPCNTGIIYETMQHHTPEAHNLNALAS